MAERNDDVWRLVLGSLVSGIAHDLNGRLTALGGVAHMARTAGLDVKLMSILDEEVQRLASSTLQLRALPLAPHGDPVPVRLGDLVQELAGLYTHRSGPRRPVVKVEGDLAISATTEPGALAEATLLLLAASEATSPVGVSALLIQIGARDGRAVLRIEGVPRERGKADNAYVDADAAAVSAEARLESCGARLAVESAESTTRYTIELPQFAP